MRYSAHLVLATVLCALAIPSAAGAESAPDAGTAFEPAPKSTPQYGTKAPDADPAAQRKVVAAADGTDLYVETWLPAATDGNAPPAELPTVLIATPYVKQGVERYPTRNLANVIQWFTARGYAVAQHHIRGTGESGGCLEQTATNQIDDVARVIEYLGRDAPWASGSVGMYGHSYDAETQVSVAGRGDPARVSYLKAIVPSASVGGQYEYSNRDGVPFAGQATLSNLSYLATTSAAPGETTTPVHMLEKLGCVPELMAGGSESSGNMTPFWRIREYRPDASRITAATLWVHGLRDFNVQAIALAGFFDRLPAATPKAGLFGVWEHNYPDKHAGVEPDWAREDFLPMVTAWYDRYLKGLDTGVDTWPVVQVQDSLGRWRAEPEFPSTGGPVGQLALGADGMLGGSAPAGMTAFVEGPDDEETVPGSRVVFTTPKLAAPLHITGVPVADLYMTTSTGDGHLGARLEVLGPDGEVLRHVGSSNEDQATYGYRSLQHVEPMNNGYFEQENPVPAPVGQPVRVPLRFLPTDLVVPAGGQLRLTLAGALDSPRQSLSSGTSAQYEILHDCATKVSALRFLLARGNAPLLNVRETDEADSGALASTPATAGTADGGGAAASAVCGKPPERIPELGPERPAGGFPAGPSESSRKRILIRRRVLRHRAGRVAIRLRCAAPTSCSGRLALTAKGRRLGTRSFRIAAQRSKTIRVKVSARALRRARPSRLTVRARVLGGRTAKAVLRFRP